MFRIDDGEWVLDEILKRGISIIAGTVFDRLISRTRVKELKKNITELCKFLVKAKTSTRRMDNPYLVIIDWGYKDRNRTVGNSRLAPRLDKVSRRQLSENICFIAKLAEDVGVRPLIHPHVGEYIEFHDEIQEVVYYVCKNNVKLCIDTGHAFYAGINPINMIAVYSDLIEYVHLKDFNLDAYLSCVRDKHDFFEACANGLTCAIGDGCLNYHGIIKALRDINYAGFLTVEIEKSPAQWRHALSQLTRSREYLDQLLSTTY